MRNMGPKNAIKMINIQKFYSIYFSPIPSILSFFVHFGSIWSMLVLLGSFCPHWYYYIHFSPIWSTLVIFSPLWFYSVYIGPFCPLLSYSIDIGPIRSTMVLFGKIYSNSVLFIPIRYICLLWS